VLFVTVFVALWSGCSLRQPLHEQRIAALDRFEFRKPDGMDSIVIGAPHAGAEPHARDFALWMSLNLPASNILLDRARVEPFR